MTNAKVNETAGKISTRFVSEIPFVIVDGYSSCTLTYPILRKERFGLRLVDVQFDVAV